MTKRPISQRRSRRVCVRRLNDTRLLTGSNGLLGQKLAELFSRSTNYKLLLTSKEEHSVFDEEAIPYRTLDTTYKRDVQHVVEEFEPEVIVNAAAITNVDLCETERELAWKVNVASVENLIYAAKLTGSRIIHVSTDYVFDGKYGPYNELDRPNPLSYYGRTKLASENVMHAGGIPSIIVRTMVLYGAGLNVKANFALWLIQNLGEGKPVRVVDDQIGNPTLADDLAYAILKMVEMGRTGLYHVSGPDLISRYDVAINLAEIFSFNKKLITPVKTEQFKQPAPRPLKSGFITLKAEIDLCIKMSNTRQGLLALKNQIAAYHSTKKSLIEKVKRKLYA